MIINDLQEILESDNPVNLSEIKRIIYELSTDCFDKIYASQTNTLSARGDGKKVRIDHLEKLCKEHFYIGERNAFYICLKLLDKIKENK